MASGGLQQAQLVPSHMPTEAGWAAHVDTRKRNKKELVKRTISFLVRVLPAFFHCALKELEADTIARIESARLPSLRRLTSNIKAIVGETWNDNLAAALLRVQFGERCISSLNESSDKEKQLKIRRVEGLVFKLKIMVEESLHEELEELLLSWSNRINENDAPGSADVVWGLCGIVGNEKLRSILQTKTK